MVDAVLDAIERDDAYRLVRVLAEKASGRTELVADEAGRLCIRKRIPLELANREAWDALAGLTHPRLPRVHECYELPDSLVVVCEYIEGSSLRELVGSRGALGMQDAFAIALDVADAASALNWAGVIHRDISPSNVIVAADGAHLIDLGIARTYDEQATHDTTRLGTWGFAAPEQYGFAQTDARSDVFSVGRLLAYMLTGCEPDTEGFEAGLRNAALVPDAVRNLIERACAFEPSKRFASCSELSAAIRDLASELVLGPQLMASGPASGYRELRLRDLAWSPSKLGVIAAIAGLVVWALMLVLGGVGAIFVEQTRYPFASLLMALVFAAGSLLAAKDVYDAYLGRGGFRDHPRRFRLFCKKLAIIIVVCLAALLVVSAILATSTTTA